jgi:hypothetical protein
MPGENVRVVERDRALRRARRLRWWVAFASFALSAAGAGYARAAFTGHHHASTRRVAVRRPTVTVVPLKARRMPDNVPLPPSVPPAAAPPAAAPAPAPVPAPVPQPAPVTTSQS